MPIMSKAIGSMSREERENCVKEMSKDLQRIAVAMDEEKTNAAQMVKLIELKYDMLEAIGMMRMTSSDRDAMTDTISRLKRAIHLMMDVVSRVDPELAQECAEVLAGVE